MIRTFLNAFVASALLAGSQHVVQGTPAFSYNSNMDCSYPAKVVIDKMTCNSGNKWCHPGDTVNVQGSLQLLDDLEQTNLCAVTRACFIGQRTKCLTFRTALYNVCYGLGLTPMWWANNYNDEDSGWDCASKASYNINSYLTVPSENDMPSGNYTGYWAVSTTTSFTDCAGDAATTLFMCTASFKATNSESNTTTYYAAAAAAAAVSALASVLFARRRRAQRRAAAVDLTHEEAARTNKGEAVVSDGNFEMMSDQH